MSLPVSPAPISKYMDELAKLDALKIAFRETGFQEYIDTFARLRSDLISHIQTS
jgi:hypothetical protein